MTLGEKIYKLRTGQGLSQEVFGENLGVSRQSVSKWETDQSVPELEKIVAISELFGVTTDYLLKEDEINKIAGKAEDRAEEIRQREPNSSANVSGTRLHYEYKSKKIIKGIPLVHVNIGLGVYRAKGIVAIGNLASGVFALGFLSAGIVSAGIISAGILLSLGTIAAGLLISMGTVAVGCFAFGAIAVGIFCVGALNFGEFCFGALSYGRQVAIGDEAHGKIALGFSRAVGELYEEVSKTYQFDYPAIEKAIDESVSPYWGPFRALIKGVLHMMGSGR